VKLPRGAFDIWRFTFFLPRSSVMRTSVLNLFPDKLAGLQEMARVRRATEPSGRRRWGV
jgi:hypothetical protein